MMKSISRGLGVAILSFSSFCVAMGQEPTESAQSEATSPTAVTPRRDDRQPPPTRYGTGNSSANDPLQFYRRNPELMKRYFPHLAAAEAGGQGGIAAPAPQSAPAPATVIPSIKFKGGSVQDLANALKTSVTPRPNIMLPDDMRTEEVPAFELQNVTLADVFQALNSLSKDKGMVWQLSGTSEPIWVLNRKGESTRFVPPVDPLTGLSFQVDPLTGRVLQPGAVQRNCQVIPIAKYLARYTIEDITTAVKTAWGLMGDETGAQMKYHSDTQLLIAVGTPEQLAILNQVLTSLDTGMKQEAEMKAMKARATSGSPAQ